MSADQFRPGVRYGATDAALIDEALNALLSRHRSADWWCELAGAGRRPVVILSRDAAIPRLRRALVAPGTTTIRGLASEVVLEPTDDPVPRRSAVNLDSVESVLVAVLVDRRGRLAGSRMREICTALAVAVDCSD